MKAPFQLSEPRADRVCVELCQALNRAIMEGVLADLRARYDGIYTPRHLIMDMRGVDDYDEDVRAPLLALQRFWVRVGRRTVYIADSARLRGLGLWVLHVANDENGRVVMNNTQTEEWLQSGAGRVQDARRRTQALLTQIESQLESTLGGRAPRGASR